MGRPRSFQTDKALLGAMALFWRQGYMATNLPDLLKSMGLTRGSFYKAFGDKRRVYLATLDQYNIEVVDKVTAALDGCTDPDPTICLALLFDAPKDPRLGCFICNAMVEMAGEDPEVASRVTAMADRMRAAIERVLRRTGRETDAEDVADLVLHLYFGSQATGRAGVDGRCWRGALDRLLRAPSRD